MAVRNSYAKRKLAPRVIAPKTAASTLEDTAPFASAIQNLFSLAGMMRDMNADPAGSPLAPKLILSGSGVEIRFAAPDGAVESVPAKMSANPEQMLRIERNLKVLGIRMAKLEKDPGGSEEWFARIEKELKEVRTAQASLARTVSHLEAQLSGQNDALESLRASVQQSEQTMETLVDSMSIMEDLGDVNLGPELVNPTDILASSRAGVR
ncbi:MAG: hypothetical protein ABI759_27610 [Candidatus Solibacter sp.]